MKNFIRGIGQFFAEADILILALSLISAIYGVILISSTVISPTMRSPNAIPVQIGAIVIGLVLFVIFTYVDIDIIADKSILLFAFSVLFILTLVVWGEGEIVGRRAWLRFWGIGIQPSEIVKVTFIIIIAKMMMNFKERKTLDSFLSIAQLGAVFVIMFMLVWRVSEDIGTALVYLAVFVIMLFLGGVRMRWFVIAGVIVGLIAPIFFAYVLEQHQRDRIMAPFVSAYVIDPTGQYVTWQVRQSLAAISGGGVFGQGLGSGAVTQAGWVPVQHTDFIFSVAAEELGFVGAMGVILLLVAIIVRCIYVGAKSNNPIGMLVCTGVAAMFITQTIMNLGMVLGIMPVIGVTLPFFSYGGSSIVTCFAALGLVSGIKMRPKQARFRSL